jgi:eukaryotic-like serine/threonine-protein kinase
MRKLGKFEILEKIGQGGMGVVYKARDPLIGRTVALKTLTTALSEDPNLLKRFYSEARAAGGLQHPNIVTIYELGHEERTPFIAMQFLNGESLDKFITRRATIPLSQKIGFVVYVCRALDYAHKQETPVIHRDIKPGNVMVTTEGVVMVVDFGIARLGEGSRSQSGERLIGTLAYMAPQLFRGGSAEARSDIWATGVMLYELLAYQRPFEGSNAAALISNIIAEKHQPVTKLAPGIPGDVEAVLNRMLCKETDARYQTMEDVLMELEPVWRRLQQTDVANLVASSRKLYESGSYASAQEELRRVLQIDTSNTEAKSLLEKVNAGIRRDQIIPLLKGRLEKARKSLTAGQLEEALAEAEAIVRADSTFQPARDFLEQAQAAVERARVINEALRASRQRLAEGALSDAQIQLGKVLEMEPGNVAALELSRQVRAENARRELKKRRDETLHRARTLWTNLQYEDCIALLISAEERFPGDPEISKLLETARQDQAEQYKQARLAEVRNSIGEGRFDDALGVIDNLLELYPSDHAAINLQRHALQGKEQQGREIRLKEEKSRLQAWLKAEEFNEVLAHGEKLAQEFPDDFELNELLDFARTERLRVEKRRRLAEYLERIQQEINDGRFSDAIQDAQKALGEFSQNAEILVLLERAKKQQIEKEKDELLQQRLKELDRMIEREELTDAIDLATKTLLTIGPHAQITGILHKAKREYESREIRKRELDETVDRARTLITKNNFKEAATLLDRAQTAQVSSHTDPRIASLFQEIEAKERASRSRASASQTEISPTPQSGSLTAPVAIKPAGDYTYQGPGPEPMVPSVPEQRKADPPLSRVNVTGHFDRTSDSFGTHQMPPPRPPLPNPALMSRMFEAPAIADETSLESWGHRLRLRVNIRKLSLLLGALVAAGFLISGVAHYLGKARGKLATATAAEISLQKESQELRGQGKLDEAQAKDQEIAKRNGPLAGWANDDLEAIKKVEDQERDLMAGARAAEQQKDYPRAQQSYQQVVSLNGPQRSAAQAALASVNAIMNGEAAETIARKSFDAGVQAFGQRDYGAAEQNFRESLNRAPEDWVQRAQTQTYLKKTEQRIAQRDSLQRAQNDFATRQYQLAQADSAKAANIPDGDSQIRDSALELQRRSQARENQRQILNRASSLEAAGQLEQAQTVFNQVSSFTDGDDLVVQKGREGTARVANSLTARNVSSAQLVDDLIKQGQFDSAESKLKGLPSSYPDYGKFKSAIASGRSEDRAFETRKAELARAEAGNDESALKAADQFFKGTVAQAGRHSREAADLLPRIDRDLKAISAASQPPAVQPTSQPAAQPTSVARVPTDQDKINELKENYKRGFETKNIKLLRHIWPSITDKNVKAYEDIFKQTDTVRWDLRQCEVPSVTGDTATFRCQLDMEMRIRGDNPQHHTDDITFHLEKQGNDWTIATIDSQKSKR